jgi:hypothetical protein
MAFQSAANWSNLPGGVFSPTIYSKKVQMAFRKKAVAQDITNSDYFGEIANFGDSVKIIKEPEITVVDYARGTKLTPQDLQDSDFTLTVDRAKAWIFKVDDIEESQSHVNWQEMARNRAAYRLADNFDQDILGYASGYEYSATTGLWTARTTAVGTAAQSGADSDELLSTHKLIKSTFSSSGTGTNSIPVGVQGTYDVTPLQLLNRMARIMDQENVDKDNRWIVVDPVFLELLSDENSKLVNNDYMANQDAGGVLNNGLVLSKKIRGFSVYASNNLPVLGTGPDTVSTTGSSSNYGIIVAGHKSAVATAEQMAKTETMRAVDFFGDVVRGMHLYGRKILRPECLIRAKWNVSR